MATLHPDELSVPAIVEAELLLGAAKSNRPVKTRDVVRRFLSPLAITPFDSTAAAQYAEIRGDLEKQGRPIGPNDYLIAATVMASGGTLVTANWKEFERVAGLRIEDWTRD